MDIKLAAQDDDWNIRLHHGNNALQLVSRRFNALRVRARVDHKGDNVNFLILDVLLPQKPHRLNAPNIAKLEISLKLLTTARQRASHRLLVSPHGGDRNDHTTQLEAIQKGCLAKRGKGKLKPKKQRATNKTNLPRTIQSQKKHVKLLRASQDSGLGFFRVQSTLPLKHVVPRKRPHMSDKKEERKKEEHEKKNSTV
jgi:hypothetical protein